MAQSESAARLARCGTGARILDAGCGNGRHSLFLARAGFELVSFRVYPYPMENSLVALVKPGASVKPEPPAPREKKRAEAYAKRDARATS